MTTRTRQAMIMTVTQLLCLNYLAKAIPTDLMSDNRIYDDSGERTDGNRWPTVVHHPRVLQHFASRDAPYLPEEIYEDDVDSQYRNSNGRLNRNDRSLLPEYRNLCESVTRKVDLKNDPNYEYQPPHYHEVFCKSYSLVDDELQKPIVPPKQKCAHPSFHCVQRSRTLFMVRRRWESECWEPMTKVVASGCDCMWPVSSLGDVAIHY